MILVIVQDKKYSNKQELKLFLSYFLPKLQININIQMNRYKIARMGKKPKQNDYINIIFQIINTVIEDLIS